MDYLSELNTAQYQAVTYMDGPCLVIAGAGSGKTRVLTYKIAYLLEHGMKASHVLALTFTNKAAREMKERIAHIVGAETSRYLWMGTFHSICAKILRQEADKLEFTHDFTIYDTTDSKSLIKQICKDHQLDDKIYKPATVLGRISDAKNALITPQMYAQNAELNKRDRNERMYMMADIYREYQTRLRQSNAMDFDDLLCNICFLFRYFPEQMQYYQQMFEYILVDEYQDTNYAQYLIVKYLAEPQNMVCVVGDDAQSIYSFRGADIRNILTFQNGYPNARLFKLEQNYRSTQSIVGAANSLIHHNKGQIYKQVFSEKEVGEPLALCSYISDRDEAEGVVTDIRRIAQTEHRSYDQVAVLYRTNAQSRAFENELRKYGIPYRIYGGMSFYQRKEIKDAIAYFRLAVNPKDWEALARSINNPSRKIGEVTIAKIREQGLQAVAQSNKQVARFVSILFELQSNVDALDAYAFAEQTMQLSGLMAAAATDTTPEGIDRKQNLDELLTGIREFVDMRSRQGIDFTPITDFLAEVSLLTDQDEHIDDQTARVTLMTVHAAKGLEFPIVYVVGMEENLFPSQFSVGSSSAIEEERRLLYVAITRAMERCTLTYAGQRFRNGAVNFSSPSRFLQDIDSAYLGKKRSNASSARPQSFTNYSNTPGFSGTSGISGYPGKRLSRVPAQDSTSSAPECEWKVGDRISHRVFGEGEVLRIYNENDNDKIDIRFNQAGKKTLLLTYAKLTRL